MTSLCTPLHLTPPAPVGLTTEKNDARPPQESAASHRRPNLRRRRSRYECAERVRDAAMAACHAANVAAMIPECVGYAAVEAAAERALEAASAALNAARDAAREYRRRAAGSSVTGVPRTRE